MIGRGLFLSLFGESHIRQGGDLTYFQNSIGYISYDGFSICGPRKSDERADTVLIYNFCWPNQRCLKAELTKKTLSA